MIVPSHIVVLSEAKFVEGQLRQLLCGCTGSAGRAECSRQWGIGRRR